MPATDLANILQYLKDTGMIGMLLLIIVGGQRKWWVFGWQFTEAQQDRDQWKSLALRGTSLVERSLSLHPPVENITK